MSRLRPRQGFRFAVTAAALLLGLIEPALAELSSSRNSSSSSSRSSGSGGLGSSNSSSSSRSSRSSSSRRNNSDSDSDIGDDSGDDGDSRSSRSRSSSSRRSGSSRSSSGGSSKGFTAGGSGSDEAPPIVFGQKFERDGVRPRGNLISAAVFKQLPCNPTPVTVGTSVHFLCDSHWYQRIEHEGWTCYSEIYPPAGARIDFLPPGAQPITSAEGRTMFVTDDAFYAATPDGSGYMVVEPSAGLRLNHLPQQTVRSIPVLVDGVSYYRHLGVFYREEKGADGTAYVVSPSPYATPTTPAAPTLPTSNVSFATATSMAEWAEVRRTAPGDFAPPSASPRDTFLGLSAGAPPRVQVDVAVPAPSAAVPAASPLAVAVPPTSAVVESETAPRPTYVIEEPLSPSPGVVEDVPLASIPAPAIIDAPPPRY